MNVSFPALLTSHAGRRKDAQCLEQTDFDLAEPHRAAAKLQADVALGVLLVLRLVDCGLAIHSERQLVPLAQNLERVPLTSGLDRRRRLGDVDDCACAVGGIGPLIEHVELITGPGVRLLFFGKADEDTAVGVVGDVQLGAQFEIAELVLPYKVTAALFCLRDAVGERDWRVADLRPSIEALAVKDRVQPAPCANAGVARAAAAVATNVRRSIMIISPCVS